MLGRRFVPCTRQPRRRVSGPDPGIWRRSRPPAGPGTSKCSAKSTRHHSGEAISQGELIGVLNGEAKAGDTVVAAAGSPPGDLLKLWDATGGRACHLEFGFSCMGYEIPAGLGVRLAQPEGEVFVFVGDGTYLMNPTELVTAVQEDLKITVIVAENHGYQCIRRLQMGRTGRSFGNEFRARDPKTNRLEGEYVAIDFAKNAESFGARAWHVHTDAEVCAGALGGAGREADVRDRGRDGEVSVPPRRRRLVGRGSGGSQRGLDDAASFGPTTSATATASTLPLLNPLPISPLSPVLGGEGSGVRGTASSKEPCPLTPTPLPRVQGRGAFG